MPETKLDRILWKILCGSCAIIVLGGSAWATNVHNKIETLSKEMSDYRTSVISLDVKTDYIIKRIDSLDKNVKRIADEP